MTRRLLLLVALLLPVAGPTLEAQAKIRNRPGALRPGRRLAHLHIDGVIVQPEDAKHFLAPKPTELD